MEFWFTVSLFGSPSTSHTWGTAVPHSQPWGWCPFHPRISHFHLQAPPQAGRLSPESCASPSPDPLPNACGAQDKSVSGSPQHGHPPSPPSHPPGQERHSLKVFNLWEDALWEVVCTVLKSRLWSCSAGNSGSWVPESGLESWGLGSEVHFRGPVEPSLCGERQGWRTPRKGSLNHLRMVPHCQPVYYSVPWAMGPFQGQGPVPLLSSRSGRQAHCSGQWLSQAGSMGLPTSSRDGLVQGWEAHKCASMWSGGGELACRGPTQQLAHQETINRQTLNLCKLKRSRKYLPHPGS